MRNGGRKGAGGWDGGGKEKKKWRERGKGRGGAGGTVHKDALVFHARFQIA